jgi:hypothetical protein
LRGPEAVTGKIFLVARYYEIRVRRYGTSNELVIFRIWRHARNGSRTYQIAVATKQLNQRLDLIAGEEDLGRARTWEYSLSTSREKQGRNNLCLIARSRRASFPEGEIRADTRTFVSITASITFSSRAGEP